MAKVNNSFSVYLNIYNDKFVYYISNHLVTLLSGQSSQLKINVVFNQIHTRDFDLPEYLIGTDVMHDIVLLHNNNFSSNIGVINPTIQFSTPLIIKVDGNTNYFFIQYIDYYLLFTYSEMYYFDILKQNCFVDIIYIIKLLNE